MGGGHYEREVYSYPDTGKAKGSGGGSGGGPVREGFSSTSEEIFKQNKTLHKSLDPKRFGKDALSSEFGNPIVVALDVTGSMGDWAKVRRAISNRFTNNR